MVLRIAAALGVLVLAGCGSTDQQTPAWYQAAEANCMQNYGYDASLVYECLLPHMNTLANIRAAHSKQQRLQQEQLRLRQEQRRQDDLYDAQVEFYRANSQPQRMTCTTREVFGQLETTCR